MHQGAAADVPCHLCSQGTPAAGAVTDGTVAIGHLVQHQQGHWMAEGAQAGQVRPGACCMHRCRQPAPCHIQTCLLGMLARCHHTLASICMRCFTDTAPLPITQCIALKTFVPHTEHCCAAAPSCRYTRGPRPGYPPPPHCSRSASSTRWTQQSTLSLSLNATSSSRSTCSSSRSSKSSRPAREASALQPCGPTPTLRWPQAL